MKYFEITLLSILIIGLSLSNLNAQDTDNVDLDLYPLVNGYSKTNSVKDVLQYRLPTWSYSNLQFDFNTSYIRKNINYGDYTSELSDVFDLDKHYSKDFIFTNNLKLMFRNNLYSEDAILKYHYGVNVSMYSNIEKNDELDYEYLSHTKRYENKNNSYSLDGGIQHDRYLNNYLFLSGGLNTSFGLYLNKNYDDYKKLEVTDENNVITSSLLDVRNDSRNKDRFFNLDPSIGIGIGRIRNVTPIFRAIRMNRRLEKLGYESLSKENIQDLASNLTFTEGFNVLFDRPTKSQLNQIYQADYFKNKNLSAYDLLYLNEEYTNARISRYEGFRLSYHLGYDYTYTNSDIKDIVIYTIHNKYYESSEDLNTDSYFDQDSHSDGVSYTNNFDNNKGYDLNIIHSLKFDYYKNLNLKWMIGTQVEYDFVTTKSKKKYSGEDKKHTYRERDFSKVWGVNAFVLYDLTDRFSAKLEGLYKRKIGGYDIQPLELKLSTNYFVENFMVIQPYVSWIKYKDSIHSTSFLNGNYYTAKGHDFKFGITAKIFLGRSLNF